MHEKHHFPDQRQLCLIEVVRQGRAASALLACASSTTSREGSKLKVQQHAMVAEGVGLDPVEV